MAWFSYLTLSLNKISSICYLVLVLLGLGDENDISSVKRGRWNKKV